MSKKESEPPRPEEESEIPPFVGIIIALGLAFLVGMFMKAILVPYWKAVDSPFFLPVGATILIIIAVGVGVSFILQYLRVLIGLGDDDDEKKEI